MATPPPTSTTPTMTPGKFRRILLSNMESFLVHTMPLVRLCEKENNTTEKKSKKDFTLKSLWEAFHETSAFGCEVPLEMNANNKERSEKEEKRKGGGRGLGRREVRGGVSVDYAAGSAAHATPRHWAGLRTSGPARTPCPKPMEVIVSSISYYLYLSLSLSLYLSFSLSLSLSLAPPPSL